MYCGQGERAESVSHTVPNMADADQSPPSIDCSEHLHPQTDDIHLSLLSRGDAARKNNNRLELAPSPSSGLRTGETPVERRDLDRLFAPEQELQG